MDSACLWWGVLYAAAPSRSRPSTPSTWAERGRRSSEVVETVGPTWWRICFIAFIELWGSSYSIDWVIICFLTCMFLRLYWRITVFGRPRLRYCGQSLCMCFNSEHVTGISGVLCHQVLFRCYTIMANWTIISFHFAYMLSTYLMTGSSRSCSAWWGSAGESGSLVPLLVIIYCFLYTFMYALCAALSSNY